MIGPRHADAPQVAKELENPFGVDANDIPLLDFHLRFTDVLADACNANHHAMFLGMLEWLVSPV